MKSHFGKEKLETLSSRFIIELASYLHDIGIDDIAVMDTLITPLNKLNSRTIVAIVSHKESANFKENQHLLIHCSHANNFSCMSWQHEKI